MGLDISHNVKALAMLGHSKLFRLNKSTVNEQKINIMNQSKIENVQLEEKLNSEQTADDSTSAQVSANAVLGAVKRKVSFTVPHCEDWKPVVAQGFIEGDYFTGEYRLKGMTYGVTIKVSFKSFLAEKPKDKAPLIVRFIDGSIDHAYYVGYTNTVYPRSLYRNNTAKEWCYR